MEGAGESEGTGGGRIGDVEEVRQVWRGEVVDGLEFYNLCRTGPGAGGAAARGGWVK